MNKEHAIDRLSVVVPCYNADDDLELCLEALRNDGGALLDILVVDDAKFSSAIIAKALRAGGFNNVRFTNNPRQALRSGVESFLTFLAFISLQLGILNLLPIPVLDGGHIVFALIEMVARKPLHERIVSGLTTVFAILLISAMLFLSYRDVDRMLDSRRGREAPEPAATESPEGEALPAP